MIVGGCNGGKEKARSSIGRSFQRRGAVMDVTWLGNLVCLALFGLIKGRANV